MQRISMTLYEYQSHFINLMNKNANFLDFIKPFGLSWKEASSSGEILVGFVLDALADEYNLSDTIDVMDVATIAWELGCVDAGRFLTEPVQIFFEEGIAV
ncbi:MAG: hypothetical protein R3B45_13355 [Bdellovibrionota bacterium]